MVELGYGTTGLGIGQRVFGLTDWARNGSLAEYTAVEARNLAPLPVDIDHTVAAALPISGLAAWQGLFDHGRLAAGQTVLVHGAAGALGRLRCNSLARWAHTSSAPAVPRIASGRFRSAPMTFSTWRTKTSTTPAKSTWCST